MPERMREGAYGKEVLRTLRGSWFWSEALQVIDYVPLASRCPLASRRICLQSKNNNLRGAVRAACRGELAKLGDFLWRCSDGQGE